MALVVKIIGKLPGGIYNATGSFSNKQITNAPADVLLKDHDGVLKLHLDSSIKVSKIDNREVLHYTMDPSAPPVKIENPSEGTMVEFSQFYFNLKK